MAFGNHLAARDIGGPVDRRGGIPSRAYPRDVWQLVAITSTAAGVLDSPLVVPVSLTVTAGHHVRDTEHTFIHPDPGRSGAAAKTVAVGTSGADITFNTSVNTAEGSGWLTVSPASGTATAATPATVTITANGSSLAPGMYHGTVTIGSTSPFTSGSPASIAVTLEVKPGALAARLYRSHLRRCRNGPRRRREDHRYRHARRAGIRVTASTNNNSGNWITVSPASGNTPGRRRGDGKRRFAGAGRIHG